MIDLLAEPSAHNIAWSWVNYILPSDTSTAWGKALSVFSSVLAFMAGLTLAYRTVSGIVQSAYTGKVLGERWHQIWAPLRIVLGFGLLVPVADFSAIHHGIKDVVARSAVNLGDAIWVTFVDSVAGQSVPITPAASGGSGVILSLLEHEICAAIYNRAGDTWGWQTRLPDIGGKVSGNRVYWSYGPTCGSLSYTLLKDRPTFSAERRAAVGELITTMRAQAEKYAAAVTETTGINSSDAYIRAIANGSLPVSIVADIRSAGAAFDQRLATAAQAEAATLETESRARLVAAAKQQGWMAAGGYWRGLAEISMLGNRMSGERPERQSPRLDSDFGLAIAKGFEALRFQVNGEAERVELSANDFTSAADDRADILTKIVGPLARDLGQWAGSVDPKKDVDAMGRLVAAGQVMVSASESAVALGGVVMVGASNWFAEKLGANGAAVWFLDWAKFAIAAVWLVGALWAYVVPMFPTVFVFIAGCLFIVSIMEALIASLLWCMTFMNLDNDDFIGSAQRMGLRLLINISLRPALSILALCAGFLFFPPALDTLDALWPLAFFAQTGGYVPGLSSIIVMLVVKSVLIWVICTRGFGLIASMPDRIAAWLEIQGAGATMHEADHTAATTAAATSIASRGTPGALPSRALSRAKPTDNNTGGAAMDRRPIRGSGE